MNGNVHCIHTVVKGKCCVNDGAMQERVWDLRTMVSLSAVKMAVAPPNHTFLSLTGRLSPWQHSFLALQGDNKVGMCLKREGDLRDDGDGCAQRERHNSKWCSQNMSNPTESLCLGLNK